MDLKPEVTRGCGFESRLWQEVSTTEERPLSKAPNPLTAPRAPQCRLPTAPGVYALGWIKCREHISLLIILCRIVYVTNKAHLSLICNHIFFYLETYYKINNCMLVKYDYSFQLCVNYSFKSAIQSAISVQQPMQNISN